MNRNCSIVFLGEDAFSNVVLVSLLKAGYKIPAVITPLYNNNIHKKMEYTALQNNIEYIRTKNINSDTIIGKIAEIKPDLLITVHFEKLLGKALINIPSLGCLNLHPSILPFYRGMSPQHWPIINGEKKTGITVHFIDEGIDTGNIVLQYEIVLNDTMYVHDLQMIWAKMYQTVMCEAIEMVINGEKGEKQSLTDGSYYGKLKSEQCEISIVQGIKRAYNLIRGVSMPYHGAYIQTKDKMIIIWKAEIISNQPLGKTGEIMTENNKLYLPFYDGTLLINKYAIHENYSEIKESKK
ncbi:MAG: methionyl-tRNA formyltransferase [Bacteroidales bacterium]|jgi:methionyl-tRNA formyltransferase|nr:methionyl-tRNA formyltransferase [Bacteroidales bacterium]